MNADTFHNIINSNRAQHIIETSAKTLMENPNLAERLPSILLRGAPGVGKSTIVRDIAARLNIGFVDVRLAQMDRCDLCGIPSVENGMTHWNIPTIWPQDNESAGIIFFDELTSAAPDVQVAAYSMILDRKIPNTNYKLPPRWLVVAAGNRAVDRAVVKTLSSALANRFMHFTLEVDAEQWNEWAVQHNINPSVTGYIQYRPANLINTDKQNLEEGYPTPRSWEKVSNMLEMFGDDEAVLRSCVYGLVGAGVGTEFMEFNKIQRKFANVVEWLTNPKAKIEIPSKADEKAAVCSAIAYNMWKAKNPKDQQTRVEGLFRVLNKMTADFGALMIHLCSLGNAEVTRLQAITMLMKSPSYTPYMKEYGATFNKKYSLT